MPPPTVISFDHLGLSTFTHQWRRRSFLRGTLLLAGAASAGLISGCQPGAVSGTTSMLSQVLRRLQPVALPDVAPLVSAKKIAIEKNVNAMLSLMDAQIVNDLDMAAALFEYGASVLGWHFARFSSLNDADAFEYVERWQNGVSMQRGIVTVFKKLLYASYWRDPSTWAPVGFEGPVSEQWGLPSLGNAPFPEDLARPVAAKNLQEAV